MNASRIAALFLAFGIAWILLSDRTLEALVTDADHRASVQSIKGMVFVLLSAALVYLLVRASERTQRRMEAQTIAERDRLAQVLNVSPAVIYALRACPEQTDDAAPRFEVDFVGDNVEAVTGFAPGVWIERPNFWGTRLHPNDAQAAFAAQKRLFEHGKVSHEYRFVHANGSHRWIHDDVVLLKDALGRPHRIVGAWLDVTDRKQAELAHVESEHRYRELFEGSPFPMWVLDTQTRGFLSVNNAALAKYGYTRPEFLALHLHDLRPVAERAQLDAFLDGVKQNPRSGKRVGEWLHHSKSGQPFWVEIVGSPIEYDGRPCQMILAQDITERRQAEDHSRVIAQVFESSQEGIFITDADTRFISVNRSFTRITGYGMDELQGRTPSILSSDRQDAAFYRAMWEQIQAQGRWEGEIWNRRKTGEIYPEWLIISAITNADNRVMQYLGIFTETSSRKDAEARIERLANYDSLTNLPNRALLFDRAKVVFAAATRNRGHAAVMHLNVDHFKNINESFGHDAGDSVLLEVAQRLVHHLKPDDTVSRLGGDDFIILLPHTTAMDAAKVAMRVMAALEAPLHVADQELRITASVGVAEFPDNGADLLRLTQAAETAVNQAKRDGRNTVCFFSSTLHQQMQEALAMERDLQHAVDRGQLVLHYQPQVNALTERIVGVEALVRWQHPEWGLVPPARFIPVAEKAGLIRKIGEWVLVQALADSAAWQAAGLPKVPVAVNLSVAQFRHEGLRDFVATALAASGLPPAMLELELTESVAMEDSDFTIATIHNLKQLGVALSIDDFGTGYSSLSYLKRFAIDKLKIDQSFVRGLNTDPEDEAIVTAVISLAKSLGLKTIAEGVETPVQANVLRAKGCDEFQGYLFSRPVPAAEFAKLLAA